MCGNRCTGSGVGGACSLLGAKHLSPQAQATILTQRHQASQAILSRHTLPKGKQAEARRQQQPGRGGSPPHLQVMDLQRVTFATDKARAGVGTSARQAGIHQNARPRALHSPGTTLDLPKPVWKQGWKKVSGSWHSGQLAWCVGVDGWCWGFRCHLEDLEKETRWSGVWNTEALRLAKENSRPSIRPEAPTTEAFQVSGWSWTITQSGGSQTAGRGHICSEPTEPGVLSRWMWGFRRDEKESGPQQVWDEQPRHRPFRLRFITPGSEGQRPPCGDQSSPDTDTGGTHKLAQATGHCPSALQSVLKHTHTVKFQRKLTLLLYPP